MQNLTNEQKKRLLDLITEYFNNNDLSDTVKNFQSGFGDMIKSNDYENGNYDFCYLQSVNHSNTNLIVFLIELKEAVQM